MGKVYVLDGVTLGTGRVRMGSTEGFVSVAERGTINESGIILDDAPGNLVTVGFRPFVVTEPACVERPDLFHGFLGPRVIDRSLDIRPSFKVNGSNAQDTSLYDLNLLFTLRRIYLAEGKRPAEWDYQRRDWIMGSRWLSGLVFDNGFVSDDEPAFLDEADYRGQTPADVLNDCVAARFGKNYFAYWDPSADSGEEVSLFYGPNNTGIGLSDIVLSNVLADQDGDPADLATLVYDATSASLKRTPEEVYSGVYIIYNGGSIYRENPATAAQFIRRDLFVNNPRISRPSTAESIAAQLLARHGQEDDRITCRVRLPKEKAGWIAAGMTISAKFSHLPGYEDFTTLFIEQCVTIPDAGDNRDWYDFELELTGPAPSGGGPPPGGGGGPGGGGNPPGPYVPPTTCDETTMALAQPVVFTFNVSSGPTVTLAQAPSPGNLLVIVATNRDGLQPAFIHHGGNPASDAGFTTNPDQNAESGPGDVCIYYKIADGSEQSVTVQANSGEATYMEFRGVAALDAHQERGSTPLANGEFATTPALEMTGPGIIVAGIVYECSDVHASSFAPAVGWTEVNDQSAGSRGNGPAHWAGYRVVTAAGSYTPTAGLTTAAEPDKTYAMQAIGFLCSAQEESAPSPGQSTCEQFLGDGTADVRTLNNPYLTNSLTLRIGGVPAVPVETDPTTGEWAPPFAVACDVPMVVCYQASAGPPTGETNPPPTSTTTIPPQMLGSGATGDGTNVLHDDGTWHPIVLVEQDVKEIGRWEPVTTDVGMAEPEFVFEDQDIVMEWVPGT